MIIIHPVVLQHPGRIAALEYRTGLRAVWRNRQAQLVPVDAEPPRSALNPRFTLAGMRRLLDAINTHPGPEAA